MEDAEDVSSNAAQSKEEEIVETDSQGSQFDDMNSHAHLSNKPGKGTPPSDFLLADFSDDEPLVLTLAFHLAYYLYLLLIHMISTYS